MKKKVTLILLLLTGFAGISAQQYFLQQWIKLGDVTATSKFDNESIMVSGADKFRSVKLKAQNAGIQIISTDLYYQSGEVQNSTVKITLDSGKESAPIPLKSGQALKKVVFSYKLFPGKQNEEAVVELYGIK
jgi:hypothetical protein